jgi:hypothetical protein
MVEPTKTPVVFRKDYIMYLEFFDNLLWFHTNVHNWSKTVKTKYLEDLNLLQYLIDIPLVALVEEHDTKLAKFGKTIGFEFKQPFLGQDNKMYHIYSRSL